MADQTSVLRFIADYERFNGEPATVDAVAAGFPSQRRRALVGCIGRLLRNQLLQRPSRAKVFPASTVAAGYRCADAGRKLLASGTIIKSGGKGPRTGLPKKTGTMRERIWQALRVAKKATAGELAELVHREGDPDPVKVTTNTVRYLWALHRAGIVTVLSSRAPGYAPSSNGFNRYALMRDLGPKAPLAGRDFLTDPNSGTRINYRKKVKP